MTELRNVEADLARFRLRVLVVSVVVLLCFLLLVGPPGGVAGGAP